MNPDLTPELVAARTGARGRRRAVKPLQVSEEVAAAIAAGVRWWRSRPPSSVTACRGRRISTRRSPSKPSSARRARSPPRSPSSTASCASGSAGPSLERLAKADDVLKLSRADLAFGVVSGRPGATTVAATMIVAKLAGIGVFATGGIGGVHRGAEQSFDISADLGELARTDVVVVAAGAKALLDLPKTLEVLETLGVPVVCYGSDEFPAFWSRKSGLPAPLRLDRPAEIAELVRTRAALGLTGGMLVANPVPAADEIPADEMAAHIEAAQRDAVSERITGKAVTPFLLDRILKLTGGRSLVTNIALIKNNARLAAEIALAFSSSTAATGRPAAADPSPGHPPA